MENKYMKKYTISLVFREMQIKPTMTYHCIPIRMAKIKTKLNQQAKRKKKKKADNTICKGGCRSSGTFMNCWYKCQIVQPFCKTV